MLKQFFSSSLIFIFALILAGCEAKNYGNKQTGGALLGGVIGGILGSKAGSGKGKLVTTAIGTAIGIHLGSEIGKSLDKADIAYARRTTNKALESNPSGKISSWTNPDSGNSGTIKPTKTVISSAGQPCREYYQTITVGGRTEKAYGRACRDASGDWRIVN